MPGFPCLLSEEDEARWEAARLKAGRRKKRKKLRRLERAAKAGRRRDVQRSQWQIINSGGCNRAFAEEAVKRTKPLKTFPNGNVRPLSMQLHRIFKPRG